MLGVEPGTLVGDHRLAGLTQREEIGPFLDARMADFDEEVSIHQPQTVVLTNERLSSNLNSPERVSRFATWIKERFSDATVLVYLRRQDEMHLAMHSTRVKVGRSEPFRVPPVHSGWDRYDYCAMLDLWSEAFGQRSLIVRVFESQQLSHGDVVQDFCATVGIDVETMRVPRKQNLSLGADALEFLRVFNQFVPYESSDPPKSGRPIWSPGISEYRGGLLPALDQAAAGDRPLAWHGDVSRRDFLKRYDRGNSRIAKEYLGRADGRLFLDSPESQESPHVGSLSTNRAVEIAAGLWIAQRQRIIELEETETRLRASVSQLTKARRRLRRRLKRALAAPTTTEVTSAARIPGSRWRVRLRALPGFVRRELRSRQPGAGK